MLNFQGNCEELVLITFNAFYPKVPLGFDALFILSTHVETRLMVFLMNDWTDIFMWEYWEYRNQDHPGCLVIALP